jgi:hypothetical protein
MVSGAAIPARSNHSAHHIPGIAVAVGIAQSLANG